MEQGHSLNGNDPQEEHRAHVLYRERSESFSSQKISHFRYEKLPKKISRKSFLVPFKSRNEKDRKFVVYHGSSCEIVALFCVQEVLWISK